MIRTFIGLTAGLAFLMASSLGGVGAQSTHAQDEWEESSSYYEDDAWYDISEWLDGNDYNPIDESFWEWDDETYDRDLSSTDMDSDRAAFGYADDVESDWYYDYYDDGYGYYDSTYDANGVYDYSYNYYDYDDDGYYDAYASYYDWDGDGSYEDVSFYTFNDANEPQADRQQADRQQQQPGNQQQAQQQAREQGQAQAARRSSKRFQLTGEVQSTKTVKVQQRDHLVAQVKLDDGSFVVDLGPAEQAKQWNISQGDQLTAQGPVAKVGDKTVLVAKSVKKGDGEMQQIDRSGRQLTGVVKKTKTAQIRGHQHQVALINSKDQEKQVLVDLGHTEKLANRLSEGDEVTVHGVRVRINNRPAIVAHKVEHDGETIQINRRKDRPGGQAVAAGNQQQSETAQRDQTEQR